MKTYWLKDNCNSSSFTRGKGYTIEELKQITGVFNESIFIEQILMVFDEIDTSHTIEEELEVELGMLRKYGQTTLHGVRTTINPLYPTFRFTLYVCSERAGKVYSTKWLAQLPLWLWTMLPDDMNGPVTVKDFATTFQVFVKDEQRVWDIMEKMHGLQCTLK